MLSFSTLLLRSYYAATGWNEDNLYSNITRPSSALLDFPIPDSLVLQLAKAPTNVFFTSYALDALPQLNGSVSYITTSVPVRERRAYVQLGPARAVRFRDVVERFRVCPPPRRPLAKDEVWLGGRRVEGRDYLLYSRLHLPTLHLTGLATARLSPTLQAHLAFINQPAAPARPLAAPPHSPAAHRRAPSAGDAPAAPPQAAGNIHLCLAQDTGRWSGEYTYSAADGLVGLRGLYNFGWPGAAGVAAPPGTAASREGKRIDEEDMMDGGLRGRFSAGGEVYFSAKQRSFGISTGLRFTTIPSVPPSSPSSPSAPPPSPPTTLTLLYNPLIGFLSTSYAAQISPALALGARFGVNVYSYESDLSVGGEWWIGQWRRDESKAAGGGPGPARRDPVWARRGRNGAVDMADADEPGGVRPDARRFEGVSLRADEPDAHVAPGAATAAAAAAAATLPDQRMRDERDGVLKARLSGNWSIALLYESRIRNCLVSIGVISDLLSRQKPIRALGLEVQYYS